MLRAGVTVANPRATMRLVCVPPTRAERAVMAARKIARGAVYAVSMAVLIGVWAASFGFTLVSLDRLVAVHHD